ncbi:hypothetical protein AAMO2058_001343800, partial [Amorphochlora amoebiformis]
MSLCASGGIEPTMAFEVKEKSRWVTKRRRHAGGLLGFPMVSRKALIAILSLLMAHSLPRGYLPRFKVRTGPTAGSGASLPRGVRSSRTACFARRALRKGESITVMGGGSFGVSMAIAAASNGHHVTMLVRRQEVVDQVNQHHSHPRFEGLVLDEKIRATVSPEEAFGEIDDYAKPALLIHAVPVQASRSFLSKMKPHIPPDVPILSCSKGIE